MEEMPADVFAEWQLVNAEFLPFGDEWRQTAYLLWFLDARLMGKDAWGKTVQEYMPVPRERRKQSAESIEAMFRGWSEAVEKVEEQRRKQR